MKTVDGDSLVRHTEVLAAELETHSDVIDVGIITRLRDMISPVISGVIKSDVVVPALVPSLSNLFGAMSNLVIQASTEASIVLGGPESFAGGVLLLVLCKKIVEKFFPLFLSFQPLRFISPVIEFSAKYFSPIIQLL